MEDKRVQGIKMKFFEQFKIGINRKSPDLEKEKDVPEAIRPYLADAQAGNSEAQYQLALLYLDGNGVKKNEKTAVEWLTKASDQGHVEAMKKLSWCYLYAHGVKQSLSYALELSQKADGTSCKVDMNKFGALVRK